MIDEWKPIAGFETRYEISKLGKVKSLSPGHKLKNKRDGTLSGALNKGYEFVVLSSGPIKKLKYIHALVMEGFVGIRPQGMEVNHKNGIRNDNRLENLEYVTRSQNIRHGLAEVNKGRNLMRGTGHCWHKLTELVVSQLRKDAKTMTYPKLRQKYKLAHNTLWCAVNRKTWRHVS